MASHTQINTDLSPDELDLKRHSATAQTRHPTSPMAAWLVFCVFLNCTGWALSALHALNPLGYGAAFLLALTALIVWRKKTGPLGLRGHGQRLKRRFRRPFPCALLIVGSLAVLGGVLYAPSNYDGLAYRLPRVLHWLAEERWHWIHSNFPRVNTRATGVEWVSAPILALLRTDRPLFLINVASFLLLPGLVFSVFKRLGVQPRVAWHWMWIFPTGYCFLLQVGSIGNDLFGAVFALGAVDFALRARETRSARDVLLSILAAAMFTNSKLSNLPLLLPWAIAFLPSLPLLARWPVRSAAICVVALVVSLVPNSIQNWRHYGDWTGLKSEGVGRKDKLVQFCANAVLINTGNFVPPVFPFAKQCNRVADQVIPPAMAERLLRTMEMRSDNKLCFQAEIQTEESSGLGFGVSVLLAVSVAAVLLRRTKAREVPAEPLWRRCVRWSPAISLLALMVQSNLGGPGRLLTPYYALLLPIVLAGAGHERLVKRAWWRASVWVVFAMAAGLVILSPARPLFPALTILKAMRAGHADSRFLARAEAAYTVYRNRNDAFAPVRAVLPPGLKILGMFTFDEPETSLWRPFGARRILHVRPEDSAADMKQRKIEFVLVKLNGFENWFKCTPEEWFARINARPVQKIPLVIRVSEGTSDWCLVQLQ